ncbi:SDR family NAD(P)-dependent oxidoreductase [Draconibacterium sediminis]|uniref:SDR family NAD(P)-dependent oxidoreductase n=1 Tax=Draconibacterium sediminis TaxID=1544798 RepID=UPI000698917C|nr:SDR family NAD(P)-dependent oxidoreductase [Draconibacterium sediminis]
MKTEKNTNKKQAVLITGASTGIGYATALYLDKAGYQVYASVRKEADKQKLIKAASSNLTPVIMDVCDEEAVNKAYQQIKTETEGYAFSLVNNAGVSLNGPLELIPYSNIKMLLDVNISGLILVTKTFLPLIRNTKGRIINISSGHGLLAIPDKSVYAASKFAVQAISDSLRVELSPFGVKVSVVVPGKINTNVLGKIMDEREKMIDQAQPETAKLYSTQMEYFDREVKNLPCIEAVEVAKVITKSLSNPKPKAQYLAGPGAKKMKIFARFPRSMRDNMIYKAIYK